MSKKELAHLEKYGELRFGKTDETYVSDTINANAKRARQRLGLPKQPEVRVTLEVEKGRFSAPTKVEQFKLPEGNEQVLPGGGKERVTIGRVPAKIIRVDEYKQ